MAKLSVQLLSLLFGTGSWIAITGLWLEVPVLIERLPESWALASDMNFVIQLANVGPIVYFVCKRYKWLNETNASHILMAIGLASCLLLITCWDKTFVVAGSERSVPLFVATFGLALLDCASSVTFLPFMARFDNNYLTPYLIGEGLSGFLPTIFALLQGVQQSESCEAYNEMSVNASASDAKHLSQLTFSAQYFFVSLLFTLMISWLALILLQILPVCKQEVRPMEAKERPTDRESIRKLHDKSPENVLSIDSQNNYKIPTKKNIGKHKYNYFLCLILLCCLSTFGFMPSIQPYSALPYGNSTLHYIVILSGLSYPFGCFLAMVYNKQKSIQFINCLTFFAHLIAIYIIICSAMSPYPPLSTGSSSTAGSALIIFSWIAFTTILSYVKTIITLIISDYNGDKGLFWVGFHTQLGSLSGATLMFVIINYTNAFQSYECNNN